MARSLFAGGGRTEPICGVCDAVIATLHYKPDGDCEPVHELPVGRYVSVTIRDERRAGEIVNTAASVERSWDGFTTAIVDPRDMEAFVARWPGMVTHEMWQCGSCAIHLTEPSVIHFILGSVFVNIGFNLKSRRCRVHLLPLKG